MNQKMGRLSIKVLSIILLCANIIFMAFVPIFPMIFGVGPDRVAIRYYPYFHVGLIGYAAFAPFATAILSCLWLLLSITNIFYEWRASKRFSLIDFSLDELFLSKPGVVTCGIITAICSGICVFQIWDRGLFSLGALIVFVLSLLIFALQIVCFLRHR